MANERTTAAQAESMQSKTADEGHIEHIFKATGYSLAGLSAAWRHEMAFRIEMIALMVLLPVLVWLPVSWAFKAIILLSMVLVLIAELLNSAVEWVVDYISLAKHPLAKRAKDIGSAAVFCALVHCGIQWAIGFGLWLEWLR